MEITNQMISESVKNGEHKGIIYLGDYVLIRGSMSDVILI